MALKEKYYEAAHAALEARRAANRAEENFRRMTVAKKIPEYAQLEKSLAANSAQLVPIILAQGADTHERLEALKTENLMIQRSMAELLKAAGFAQDYLSPVYTCRECRDEGCRGGKWCGCFMKLVYAAASKELNDQSPMKLKHFEDFDLSLYPDAVDDLLKQNIRATMKRNFAECVEYAESFDGSGRGLLMSGATGLGKTHLSLAVANRVIERGYSVIYGSAPELLRMLDNEQFGRSNGDTMSLLTGCDLLILDDLGAENSTERNTSQLYEIINARMNRGIPLIVSTNLTLPQLRARYQDRICSRLLSLNALMFCGTDNRLKTLTK